MPEVAMTEQDELEESEAERLWLEEAQRRLAEYQAGRARVVSAEEVAAKAEKILRAKS